MKIILEGKRRKSCIEKRGKKEYRAAKKEFLRKKG